MEAVGLGILLANIIYAQWQIRWRYCTFVAPFFIDDSGAEFHAD